MAAQNHPLKKICQQWLKKIEEAKKYKKDVFGRYADAANQLFCGESNWMWDQLTNEEHRSGARLENSNKLPNFRLQVNRLSEAVALYGPTLIHQNPEVQVNPKNPPRVPIEMFGDPEDQMLQQALMPAMQADELERVRTHVVAELQQHYLNEIQESGGRLHQSRRAVTEAIVTGMGGLLTEMYTPPGSQMSFPKSRFLSQDCVVWDPDAKHYEDITWMAIRWCEPINRFCEKYSIPYNEVRKEYSKSKRQSAAGSTENHAEEVSKQQCDMVTYWEVYSKNGMGQWLHALDTDKTENQDMQDFLEYMGRFVRIVVAEGVDYPINMPHEAFINEQDEQLIQRCQWPIPFYLDESAQGGWPYTPLYYYEQTMSSYPMSITRPAMPLIEFINYLISCLADKTAAACETYMGVLKEAVEDFESTEEHNLVQSKRSP